MRNLSALTTWLKSGIAVLVMCLALPLASVQADGLEQARAAGLIGELPDGYVASVTPNPTPDIQQLITDINAERRKSYMKIAGERGVPVEAAGAVVAEVTIRKLKPGMFYMDNSGQWVQK
ncbi:YdbL family protein [Dongia sp.]|uniref:YdbL family protein n=1 Tax=Dongia sp. TaxID=1977262 RepID=UPI003752A042